MMLPLSVIGLIVVSFVIYVGVYWLLSNVKIKRQPECYTYKKDGFGNEYVQDNAVTSEDEPDAKA